MAYLPNYMASNEHSQEISATSPLLNKYCDVSSGWCEKRDIKKMRIQVVEEGCLKY